MENISFGHHEPHFNFDTSEEYEQAFARPDQVSASRWAVNSPVEHRSNP